MDKMKFECSESIGLQLQVFIDAHHDGDIDSAISDLLLCHKVLVAKLMQSEEKKYKKNNNHITDEND